MSDKPKYYVWHGTEICRKDLDDGDDVVLAICGANSSWRSSPYSKEPHRSNVEMAQRIVDLLNGQDTLAASHARLQAELERCKGIADRLEKLYRLAAEDVIFFSTYCHDAKAWKEDYYSPCVSLNDTFAYACADAERLQDSEIDLLTAAWKKFGQDGVVAWAATIRKADPISPCRTDGYVKAKDWIDAARASTASGEGT